MREDELLLKSIKKLLALKVSEQEINTNLKEMGIREERAHELIKQAKGMTQPKEEDVAPEEPDEASEEALEEVLVEGHTEKEERSGKREETEKEHETETEEFEPPVKKKPEIRKEQTEKIGKPEKEEKTIPRETVIAKLWEKGILVTVNQRLEEMKKLKEEIEGTIDLKVRTATESERKKIQVLMESQRALLGEKITAELTGKEKQISEIIDSKIKELVEQNEEIRSSLQEVEILKSAQKQVLKDFDSKKDELAQVRTKVLSELNSELIKIKSQAEQVLTPLNEKLLEIDARVEKALELESKIVEGLVGDAEGRIEKMKEDKKAELAGEIEEELAQLESVRSKIDPEKIQQKIKELNETEKRLNAKLGESEKLLDEYKRKLEAQLRSEMGTQMENLVEKRVLDMRKELNVTGLKKELKALSEFKEQFIQTIQSNVEKFNEKIGKLDDSSSHMIEEFNLRVKKIDDKIAELDVFEKSFAEEMGVAVEELIKKERSKKGK